MGWREVDGRRWTVGEKRGEEKVEGRDGGRTEEGKGWWKDRGRDEM